MDDKLKRHGLVPESFKAMTVRPHEIADSIMDARGALFSKLASWRLIYQTYPEDAEALCRYIVYMYDQDTPMTKLFPDLNERRSVSFDLSGMTNKSLQKMMLSSGLNAVQRAIFDFLKLQKNALWNLIVVNEAMFYECMDNLMQDTKMDKDKDLLASLKIKSELAVGMENAQVRLKKYIREFYNEDTSMVETHDTISQRMSSESIAEQMSRHGK